MVSHYAKAVSKLDSWNIVLSTVVCGICFAEPDTILVFNIYFGVFGEGSRLAMPKTICAPDSSSLKPGSGATEGPELRGPRIAGLYALAGLLDYKDTRLKTPSHVRMGLSLAWKASLGIQRESWIRGCH